MKPSASIRVACGLAVLAGLGAGAGLAGAQGDIESTATIYFTAPNILNGKVNSGVENCLPGRTVKFRKAREDRPDKELAKKTTKAGGYFQKKFAEDLKSGAYYARITRREISAGACAPVNSNTTTVTAR